MLLRRLMSVIAAVTIFTVVGSYALSPAHAHNGHSHGAAVSANLDAVILSVDEIALALVESGVEESARGDVTTAGKSGLTGGGAPPCDGHCCAAGGTPCCGYVPVSLALMTWVTVIDLGSTAPVDSILDGLDPEFILRPPKSFA
jgi:hypothetical protein